MKREEADALLHQKNRDTPAASGGKAKGRGKGDGKGKGKTEKLHRQRVLKGNS